VNFSPDEQGALLAVAREAVAAAIGLPQQDDTRPPVHLPPPSCVAGAFVSIHVGGELRGCVGYPEPDLMLEEVVRRCAVSAATSDYRFPAVQAAEWPRVSLEISVLTPITPIQSISEIDVGRHGLIVQLGGRRGLLLPQVATEHGWTREEFVAQTCRKAGVPADAWRAGAQLFTFEAHVFGD
jgi:AmmeMemoRadiSam system protein A